MWRRDASVESFFSGLVGLGRCGISGAVVFVDALVELLFLRDRPFQVLLERVEIESRACRMNFSAIVDVWREFGGELASLEQAAFFLLLPAFELYLRQDCLVADWIFYDLVGVLDFELNESNLTYSVDLLFKQIGLFEMQILVSVEQ